MALTKCKECGKEVSKGAKLCPHCGIKNPGVKASDTLLGIVLIVFIIGVIGAITGGDEAQETQTQTAQQSAEEAAKEEALKKAFFENKESIISKAKGQLDGGHYEKALSVVSPYSHIDDPDLASVWSEARTGFLLADLKKIPASAFELNRVRYKELVDLHPENPIYKEKLAHYAGKIKEVEELQRKAKARTEMIEQQFSAWDGSHRNLERVIKAGMNDPDSYEHVETRYGDRGDHLIVSTTFRGRNAFNGMVVNTVRAKVAMNGDVLGVIE
jgi:hypothetical protein